MKPRGRKKEIFLHSSTSQFLLLPPDGSSLKTILRRSFPSLSLSLYPWTLKLAPLALFSSDRFRPRLIALRVAYYCPRIMETRYRVTRPSVLLGILRFDSPIHYALLRKHLCEVSRVTTRHSRACKISQTSTWRNYLFEKRIQLVQFAEMRKICSNFEKKFLSPLRRVILFFLRFSNDRGWRWSESSMAIFDACYIIAGVKENSFWCFFRKVFLK